MNPPARRRCALAVSLCLGAVPGCRPQAKPVGPSSTAGGGRDTPGGGSTAQPAVAPITKVTEMLPPSTVMFVDLAAPTRVAEVIGRDALVTEFAKEYAQIAGEASVRLGADPFDPKQLPQFGIDPNGRFGFAILSISPLTGLVWFTIADKGRLRGKVYEIARQNKVEVVSIPMAGAEVLRPKGESSAFVLREPFAAFVFVEGQPEGDVALALASTDPLRSLASDRGFRKATGASAPADALAYLDAKSLVDAIPAQQEMAQRNWARDDLMAARARGESAERLAQLEADAKRIDEDDARWQRRRRGERALLERLLGGISDGVWTASVKPQSVVFDGRATLEPGSLPLAVLRNRRSEPLLPRALGTRPLWLMTGSFNTDEMVAFADLVAQADGTSWTEIVAEVVKETGIDLERDLRPILTGDAGFAVTLDRTPSVRDPEPARALGVAIDVELKDPSQASEVLARAGKLVAARVKAQGKAADVAIKPDRKGWIVDVKEWRKLHIGVWGNHFVVSTDADLGRRLEAGKSGDAKVPSGVLAAVGQPGSAFSALLDLEVSLWLLLGRSSSSPAVATTGSPGSKKSKKLVKAEREVARIDAKIAEHMRKRDDAQAEKLRDAMRPWGIIAGNIRTEGESMVGQGGWFLRDPGGIASALRTSFTAARALAQSHEDPELSKLFEQHRVAQQRVEEARPTVKAEEVRAVEAPQ